MTVTVKKSTLCGKTCAPPSKSDAHRCLIAAALSDKSTVSNIAESEDIKATIGCLKALGADVRSEEGNIKIGGLNPFNVSDDLTLDCAESGSTLRFLIPLCLLCGKRVTLKGRGRLMERPQSVYEEICRSQGLLFERSENQISLCGPLKSGDFKVAGDVSSQFITGLLYALPLLSGDSRIIIEGELQSKPYIDMTLDTLCRFGIKIEETDYGYFVKGNQKYLPQSVTVEGDYSNAAFLDAFNLLGGSVTVTGLECNSLQGDKIYRKMYEDLKKGVKDFDLSNCPDLAPIMFSLSAALGGAEFTGTKRLKIKESDRAEAMRQELSKFGIDVTVGENSVIVKKGELKKPSSTLYGHNDHRIVMSLAVLCSVTGGEIKGAEAVSKSFPDFFRKISTLGFVSNET